MVCTLGLVQVLLVQRWAAADLNWLMVIEQGLLRSWLETARGQALAVLASWALLDHRECSSFHWEV